MQFNSLVFAAFLAVVLPLYFAAGRMGWLRLQNGWLLIASYVFYGWWDWRFLSLLALSTVVDFVVGLALTREAESGQTDRGRWLEPLLTICRRKRVRVLQISLLFNLGLLGVFKYYDFFVTSAAELLEACGLEPNLTLLRVVLPVGISFYTFQTIAYTYSVYRREIPASRDLIAFGVYVAFFPQLVAGPIEQARRLLPQIQTPRTLRWEAVRSGAALVLLGLFKKIALADAVAGYVEVAYSDPTACSGPTLLMGTYLFALQIYGDFSGYTDIARGVSRGMGIELILNFRQPYLATNITDFWRRWHISLSTWLREHLYIPLGGNRHGKLRTYRNLMLTMLLGGLWHGAGWNFVIWGGLHGLYLAVHKIWTGRRAEPADSAWRKAVAGIVTFHLVCFAWVFFRAAGETERGPVRVAWEVISGLFTNGWSLESRIPWLAMLLLPVMFLMDYASVSRDRQLPVDERSPVFLRGFVYGTALVMIVLAHSSGEVPFLYFQF